MIRLATAADAQAVADIYAPVVTDTHYSFETRPPTAADMARRIRHTAGTLPWLVVDHGGDVLGYAYASPFNERSAYQWSVDVSVYVADGWRRRGIARGLYRSLFSLLDRQGVYTAIAIIALPNQPSVSFHEAVGFEHVATYADIGYKHGSWRDVGHWRRTIQDPTPAPAPRTPLGALADPEEAISSGESALQL